MEFYLKYFAMRFRHEETISIKRGDSGWEIPAVGSTNSICDKSGSPNLFDRLEQDIVQYPNGLGNFMEWLWERTKKDNFAEIQEAFNQLGEWLTLVEQNTPRTGIFLGLC